MQYDQESELNEECNLPGDLNDVGLLGECPPDAAETSDEPTTSKPKKMKKERLLKTLADAVAHVNPLFPEFPNTFHVLRDQRGLKFYLEELPGEVVRRVDEDRIIDAILRYSHEKLAMMPNAVINKQNARDAFYMWSACVNPIPQPAAFLQKSTKGLTFKRLPFDIQEDVAGEHTATFNELFGRITNSHALQCWIGSLMDPKADRQQYVWLYGVGGAGKSALASILMRVFDEAAISTQPPSRDDRFWSSALLGKRLVVFPDCNHYGYVATGQFKSLTGDDVHLVEEKGKPRTQINLSCKFIFLSNEKPMISSAKADIRRAIYCEVNAFDGIPDRSYHEKLWAEVPYFLGECWKAYRAEMVGHGIIRCDNEGLLDVIEENELEHERLFRDLFDIVGHESCYPVSIIEALWQRNIRDPQRIRRFMQYLELKGYKKIRKSKDSQREIRGLKLKLH